MKRVFFNPPALPDWAESFSHVVVVEQGGLMTIYLSGQVVQSLAREDWLVEVEAVAVVEAAR